MNSTMTMTKTIVYTAILGDCDSLKPAPADVRSVCFVNEGAAHSDPKGWELVPVTQELISALGGNRRAAWRIRCEPHKVSQLGDYERVIWIDASFALLDLPRLLKDAGTAPIAALRHHERDSCYLEGARLVRIKQSDEAQMARQLIAYKQARFRPKHLSISCVIVRDHSEQVRAFNETWAAQIATYPADNTQVSLDYSAWKNGLTIKALAGTRHDNPYASHDHADHKRRRKPYGEWHSLGISGRWFGHDKEAVIPADQAKEFLS